MHFYVRRTIGPTRIRFGVNVLDPLETGGDGDGFWSTGGAGEFRRHGAPGLYYTESEATGPAAIEAQRDERKLFDFRAFPTWMLGLMAGGMLFFVIGLLVVFRKGPQGWIEVILGAGMIAAPFIITAKQRRDARIAAEKERLARAEEEERRRKIVGEFAAQVERLHADVSDQELENIRKTRTKREIPLEAFAHLADAALLRIGFALLVERGLPPGEVSVRLKHVAKALGLPDEHVAELRTQIYQKLVWQLLADRRLTPEHRARLDEIRRGIGVNGAAEREASAMAQFEKVESLDPRKPPKLLENPSVRPIERGIHETPATILRGKNEEPGSLLITSRRVALRGKKEVEIPVDYIFDIEVDADRNLLRIVANDRKEKVHEVVLDDPIYAAALVQIAAAMPKKPGGLV